MDSRQSSDIATALLRRVGEGAGAIRIADAVGAVWQEIDEALKPVIGQRGVAALYKRSVHVAGKTHPWLLGTVDNEQSAADLSGLTKALAHQDGAEAAAGSALLLQSFHDLLTSLIGPALTERLLRSAWSHLLSGPPAQDISP